MWAGFAQTFQGGLRGRGGGFKVGRTVAGLKWLLRDVHCSTGNRHNTRLVVFAADVGGRWSEEARAFVSQLAKAKAVEHVLAGRVRQAYHHRWSFILPCAAARAIALSLLEKRPALGCDGDTPSPSEVVGACPHLPLDSVS